MCARLSLKVPRRRPLPARPLAAPGSDRAPAGCRAAARRFPKGARKTRSRQSASGPGAGGGAGGGRRGRRRAEGGGGGEGREAWAGGAQRPVRPLGVTGGLAGRVRTHKTLPRLPPRGADGDRQRGGAGDPQVGVGVGAASAEVEAWGAGDAAAERACGGERLPRIPALSKSFGF